VPDTTTLDLPSINYKFSLIQITSSYPYCYTCMSKQIFHLHTSTIPPHISIYIYTYILHHVIQSLIIPTYNFNHLNIILNSTLHNSIINTYLCQNSATIYNQDLYISIYPYNLQSNISQAHSHLFSCIFLHYLIITFPFTIQISYIFQY
jgi:hypothetical protein